jgi:peptide/nickel transport system ATP-binding protein
VLQLLKEVQERQKNALVIVTHDMGVLANIADRVGIMYAGKIIEEAPVDAIFEQPQHPYTQYLIHSLPKFGDKTKLESAPGAPPSLVNLPTGCAFHPRCKYGMPLCRDKAPECRSIGEQRRVACWLMQEADHRHDS